MPEKKLPHGFDTDAEWLAYEQGRADEQAVAAEWIAKWDGNTRSAMGRILHDKFEELKTNKP